MPVDFYALGNVSALELVRRSGYPAARCEVTTERLAACLGGHPGWVDAWFGWSQDNRSTPAWYVRATTAGQYEVGSVGRDGSVATQLFMGDKVAACAEYICRAVAQIADSG